MNKRIQHFPSPHNEKDRLSELLSLEILDTRRESDFDLIVLVAAELCKAPYAFISFVDAERVWIKAAFGSELRVVDRSNSYCALAIMGENVVEIPNLRNDDRTANLPFTLTSDAVMYAAAILTTPSGSHLGTLCIVDTEVRTLSQQQKDILKGLAKQVMQLLELRQCERNLSLVNTDLQQSLIKLKDNQKKLIETQKMTALSSLVAGVSHEFNTPIGNGLAVVTTLDKKLDEFGKLISNGLRRSDLQSFVSSVETATSILVRSLTCMSEKIDDLRNLASENVKGVQCRFSLGDVVEAVLAHHAPLITAAGCVASSEVPKSFFLYSYPHVLSRVLDVLINNAINHGFDQGHTGSITIKSKYLNEETVIVEVHDTGHGIDPDRLDRLFDPFFSTKFGQGGSGLGLYSAYNFVSNVLEGQIEVMSRLGTGTNVTLTLPMNVST
jgi:signal transduction histidine kinase